MKIGIDIDDTLVDTSASFDNLIKKYNISFNKKFKDNWTTEEKNFIFNNYLLEILTGAKIHEGAKEVLDYLYNKGYELIIITARSNKHCENIEKLTKDMIQKENIKISEFYFGRDKKSDIAKQLNLALMIDDSKYVCNNMEEENIDYILFGDKIKNWKEVLEYIESK